MDLLPTETHLHIMLVLICTLVMSILAGVLAEQQRLLVEENVSLLGLHSQPKVLLAVRPHGERVLQQQFALLRQIGWEASYSDLVHRIVDALQNDQHAIQCFLQFFCTRSIVAETQQVLKEQLVLGDSLNRLQKISS